MLPASSLIMSMCMKLPFSRGWINKPFPNGADRKPAWEAVTRRVMKAAADGQGHVQVHRLALSGPCSPLLLWPSAGNRHFCEAGDSPSARPHPRDQTVLNTLTAWGWWRQVGVGRSKPTLHVSRQVPYYLAAGKWENKRPSLLKTPFLKFFISLWERDDLRKILAVR